MATNQLEKSDEENAPCRRSSPAAFDGHLTARGCERAQQAVAGVPQVGAMLRRHAISELHDLGAEHGKLPGPTRVQPALKFTAPAHRVLHERGGGRISDHTAYATPDGPFFCTNFAC